jgi:hypothetical protein
VLRAWVKMATRLGRIGCLELMLQRGVLWATDIKFSEPMDAAYNLQGISRQPDAALWLVEWTIWMWSGQYCVGE